MKNVCFNFNLRDLVYRNLIPCTFLFTLGMSDVFAETTDTFNQDVSYILGRSVVNDLKNRNVELNKESFIEGINTELAGKPSKFTEVQSKELLQKFSTKMQEQAKEEMSKNAIENKSKGEKFLLDNSSKQGVIKLPSGLQYKIITEGKGESPKLTDSVVAHYRGTHLDGKEFDSSYTRGKPAEFPLGGLIKGWQEALQLMKPGSKWEIVVPATLAYGDTGAGGSIEPGETLQFTIELIEVKSAKK
jgi:FKBP-type peptidyl-prolyl cis-trans isomerase FklB